MKQHFASFVLWYLKFFAKLQLAKKPYKHIIGVTGSVGKSSARNAIYTVLSQKYKVKASFGANSESGVPLNILGLAMRDFSMLDWLRVLLLAPWRVLCDWQQFDYYIVEMGIDSPHPPKNMGYLLSIIQPDIGVFLGAGLNHAFAFDELLGKHNMSPVDKQKALVKLIATEKARLINNLPSSGQAFVNQDDQIAWEACQSTKAQLQGFGYGNQATLRIDQAQLRFHDGQLLSEFHFLYQKQSIDLQFDRFLFFPEYASTLAPAIMIGLQAGLDRATITQTLTQKLALPPGRSSILTGKHHSTIIDSSYNASGMLPMLTAFLSLKQKQGKKIVVLGDMRELGENTRVLHEQLANLLTTTQPDQIHLVGQSMQQFVLPQLQKQGLQAHHHSNALQAGAAIAATLQKGDLLLVKGSQNTIFLEEAIKPCLEQASDSTKLCRQNTWWQQSKAMYFKNNP